MNINDYLDFEMTDWQNINAVPGLNEYTMLTPITELLKHDSVVMQYIESNTRAMYDVMKNRRYTHSEHSACSDGFLSGIKIMLVLSAAREMRRQKCDKHIKKAKRLSRLPVVLQKDIEKGLEEISVEMEDVKSLRELKRQSESKIDAVTKQLHKTQPVMSAFIDEAAVKTNAMTATVVLWLTTIRAIEIAAEREACKSGESLS